MPSAPTQVILTSGHHGRDAARYAQHFGIPIRASRQADEHLAGGLEIERFEDGAQVAPGVTAIHVGVLCEDEGALHIELGDGVIALADALTVRDGRLGFFRDELLGEDPEAIKRGLTEKLRFLLDLHFDHLLLAHGLPIVGGAKAALRDFVRSRET